MVGRRLFRRHCKAFLRNSSSEPSNLHTNYLFIVSAKLHKPESEKHDGEQFWIDNREQKIIVPRQAMVRYVHDAYNELENVDDMDKDGLGRFMEGVRGSIIGLTQKDRSYLLVQILKMRQEKAGIAGISPSIV